MLPYIVNKKRSVLTALRRAFGEPRSLKFSHPQSPHALPPAHLGSNGRYLQRYGVRDGACLRDQMGHLVQREIRYGSRHAHQRQCPIQHSCCIRNRARNWRRSQKMKEHHSAPSDRGPESRECDRDERKTKD